MSTFSGFHLNLAYRGLPFIWGSPQTTDGTNYVYQGVPLVITAAPPSTKCTYDGLGRLTTVKLGTGQLISYTYDAMGNRSLVSTSV